MYIKLACKCHLLLRTHNCSSNQKIKAKMHAVNPTTNQNKIVTNAHAQLIIGGAAAEYMCNYMFAHARQVYDCR